jgi:hypothetical protein
LKDHYHAAPSRRVFALQHCHPRPLLTSNGNSEGFSVLVPLAYEVGSRAARARSKEITWEETCVN